MPVRLCSWRRGIAATDTNLTVYPPPSFEFIERSPGPPGFSFDRQPKADLRRRGRNLHCKERRREVHGAIQAWFILTGVNVRPGKGKPLKEPAMIKKLVALAFCAAFGLTSFSALAEEDHHHHYYHHHYYHHDYHHHDHHDDHHM